MTKGLIIRRNRWACNRGGHLSGRALYTESRSDQMSF